MTRLRRITVIDQAEQDIERRVRAGEWSRRLPGFKVLAEIVGVSVPTIGLAIARLASRGIVVSQGPRRPFIPAPNLAKAASAKPKVSPRYLVIALPRPLHEVDNWTRLLVLDLMRLLAREGWRCDVEEINHGAGRNITHTLEALRHKHPASHLLFLGGTPAVSDWAIAQTDVQIAFFGGKSNHPEIRSIGISIALIYAHLLQVLADLGHRRVLTGLWNAPPMFTQVITRLHAPQHKLTLEQLEVSGLYFNLGQPEPKAFKDAFLKAFRKSKPTAVIVDGLPEHVLVWSSLLELGLKVPADISLVNLSSGDEFNKIFPLPTHFKVERKFMLREIHAWIRGRPTDTAAAARRAIANWIKGDTLAPARG